MKRRQADNAAEDARKRERQALVSSSVEGLDAVAARQRLQTIATRWHLDAPGESFLDVLTTAFDNFGVQVTADLTIEDTASFGLRRLDDKIAEHEMEMIALYHKLRELELLDDHDLRTRTFKCLEQIYYAKRVVLSCFQGKLSLYQLQCDAMELDSDLDARMGSWSLRFRWINDDTNAVQRLLLHMLDCAMEKRYRRHSGWCYEPIVINGHNTHAWRPVMEIKDWVYAETRKETNWEQW